MWCSRPFFVFWVCGRPSQLESVPRSGYGMTSHSLPVLSPSILRKVWPACPSLPLRRACEIKIKMPQFFQGVSDGLFRRGSLRGDHHDALWSMSVWPHLFSSHVHVIIVYTILYLNLSTNMYSPSPFKKSYFDMHSLNFYVCHLRFWRISPGSLIVSSGSGQPRRNSSGINSWVFKKSRPGRGHGMAKRKGNMVQNILIINILYQGW